ncbi:hypothetical protein VIGAN_02164700 [Vigna angularis var. angularis]|uniref:Uncharacterized protein n=1 Tax=Vigna angularis var. angularis TaxID=157739 RepID=A0A0S3REA9_PHAAN|nr:hypothetical protein VIGAN_02164700 [Vigna angularis var. angularis]
MVVVVVVVVEAFLPVDDALDGTEVLDVARDGDGAFLLEPVFVFGFLQQLHEQWVVHVHDRDNKPLLLLPLPYQHRQTPFWNVLQVLLLLVVVRKVEVRNVQVKAHVVMMVVVVFWRVVMMIAENPHMEKEKNEAKRQRPRPKPKPKPEKLESLARS